MVANGTNGSQHTSTTVVVGGASGIGRAVVLGALKRGDNVIVADRSKDLGAAVVKEGKELSLGQITFLEVEITKPESVQALVKACVETHARIDYLIVTAGISGPTRLLQDIEDEEFVQVNAVNSYGLFLLDKYFLKQMLQQEARVVRDNGETLGQVKERGSIVNIASALGVAGCKLFGPYVASKHAVTGLIKTIALENGSTGVRANAVCPGITWTPILQTPGYDLKMAEKNYLTMQEMRRFAHPEEIAESCLWLSSTAASFVTGSIMSVDGGWTAQ